MIRSGSVCLGFRGPNGHIARKAQVPFVRYWQNSIHLIWPLTCQDANHHYSDTMWPLNKLDKEPSLLRFRSSPAFIVSSVSVAVFTVRVTKQFSPAFTKCLLLGSLFICCHYPSLSVHAQRTYWRSAGRWCVTRHGRVHGGS